MNCCTKVGFSAHCAVLEENTVKKKDCKVSGAQSVFTGAYVEQSENPVVIRLLVNKVKYSTFNFC